MNAPAAGLYRREGSQALYWQPEHLANSPLQLHAPLLFWLVENLRPAVYVTLGQHGSISHYSVCQAVRRLDLPTRCYAMAGSGEDLPAAVREQHDRLYAGFSKLLPADLDEDGLQHFRCYSVDWLQVDGLSELEQLQAHWRSWRKRLSRRAILGIHASRLTSATPMAGWIRRLQKCHPWAEFPHGEGMLVLSVGDQLAPPLEGLIQALHDPHARGMLLDMFAHLGQACADTCARANTPPLILEAQQRPADNDSQAGARPWSAG